MTESDLRAHVNCVLSRLNDGGSVHDVPRVAGFITADVLLRIHNLVVVARNCNDRCGGWTKQATMALVVGCFTGVKIQHSDAEFIGNSQDSYLGHYRKELRRARNSDSQERLRARRKGMQVQPMHAAHQMQRIFQCRYGGVPRLVANVTPHASHAMPVLDQAVPVRRLLAPLETVNLQLKKDIIELRHEKEERECEARANLSLLCVALEHERVARAHAERVASEATTSQQSAAEESAARLIALKTQLRDARNECNRALGQLARLGSQVAAAHIEVAQAQQREAKARKEVEKASAYAEVARAEEAAKAALQLSKLKEYTKQAEADRAQAQGQLARLGCQVASAHIEVAKAQQREEKARKEAKQAADDAADAHAEAVAKVTERLRAVQAESREHDTELKRCQGQLERLGSQLGHALVEAARAAEISKSANTTAEELRERLRSQEETASLELAHLRELKAQMARRARDACKRAQQVRLVQG